MQDTQPKGFRSHFSSWDISAVFGFRFLLLIDTVTLHSQNLRIAMLSLQCMPCVHSLVPASLTNMKQSQLQVITWDYSQSRRLQLLYAMRTPKGFGPPAPKKEEAAVKRVETKAESSSALKRRTPEEKEQEDADDEVVPEASHMEYYPQAGIHCEKAHFLAGKKHSSIGLLSGKPFRAKRDPSSAQQREKGKAYERHS
ncbi:hypothetical protein CY35_16G042000 [Sphagnum magellanicum]|nr:hypothetical protein CY35_16G042000 [Sphagnum magellanicum]